MKITSNAPTSAAASFYGGVSATQRGGNEIAIVDGTFFSDNFLDLWTGRTSLLGSIPSIRIVEKNKIQRGDFIHHSTYIRLHIYHCNGVTHCSCSSVASEIDHDIPPIDGWISVAGIIYSAVNVLGPLMMPKEMAYMIPGAQGNVNTCTAQGFFNNAGLFTSTFYNCSVFFYYLAIIKYDKTDAYISKKLQRWFHGIPITVSLLIGFLTLAVKGINTYGNTSTCYLVPHDPQHCIGYEDGGIVEGFSIPRGRGIAFYNSIMFAMIFYAVNSPPTIIIVTSMGMIYRTVIKIKRKAARYGVRALRLQNQRGRGECGENSLNLNEDVTPASSIIEKIRHYISC